MKRKLSLLLALLLASALLPLGAPARAAGAPEVGMGFNPSSIVPVSKAVPVYTAGDQLWVESYYNLTILVELVAPGHTNTTIAVGPVSVEPYSPTLVHTWGPSDAAGRWNLIAVLYPSSFAVQTFTVGPVPSISPPELKGYSIGPGGNLSLAYSMDLQNAYLGQGCVVGSQVQSAGEIPFAPAIGSGSMNVELTPGGAAFQSFSGGVAPSVNYFDFWLELHYPYSYASPSDASQLTTSDVLVAQTAPVTFPAKVGANLSAAFTTLAPLRQGRYEVRAFFRDALGLQVQSVTLLLDGGWIWFSGCDRQVDLASSFTFTQSLAASAGLWPSGVYYGAFSGGIEGVGYTPISLNLTRVSLRVEPYGGTPPSALSVSTRGQAVTNDTYYDGSVYLSLSKVPTQVVISVGYPGTPAEEFTLTIPSERNSTSLGVPFGEVSVEAASNGVAFPNAVVGVNSTVESGVKVASGVTSGAGSVDFALLGGNYTVTLGAGRFTETEAVQVVPGKNTILTFVVPYTPDLTLSYALLGAAAFGIALNAIVWRKVVRFS